MIDLEQVEEALGYYGDGTGRYARIVNQEASVYRGGRTLSEAVAKVLNVYMEEKGFETLEEAIANAQGGHI